MAGSIQGYCAECGRDRSEILIREILERDRPGRNCPTRTCVGNNRREGEGAADDYRANIGYVRRNLNIHPVQTTKGKESAAVKSIHDTIRSNNSWHIRFAKPFS